MSELTRAEQLKRVSKGYRKASGMSEDIPEEKGTEEPGIFSRIGKSLMDTLGEKDIPTKGNIDPRLEKHMKSIRKEIPIDQSFVAPGEEDSVAGEPGEEKRDSKVRRLIMGLKKPQSA